MKNLIYLLGLALLFGSCQDYSVDQTAEAEILIALSEEWAKAALQNDTEKVLSYWAEDAIVMTPNEVAKKGKEAIRKMVEGSTSIPGFEINWEPQSAYVSKSGDLGYVLVKNYLKFPDSLGNISTYYNKGVEIWKKQEDGSWKNVVDIYNGDPAMTSIE